MKRSMGQLPIGERVVLLLHRTGMEQRELAALLNVSRWTVRRMTQGKRVRGSTWGRFEIIESRAKGRANDK